MEEWIQLDLLIWYKPEYHPLYNELSFLLWALNSTLRKYAFPMWILALIGIHNLSLIIDACLFIVLPAVILNYSRYFVCYNILNKCLLMFHCLGHLINNINPWLVYCFVIISFIIKINFRVAKADFNYYLKEFYSN